MSRLSDDLKRILRDPNNTTSEKVAAVLAYPLIADALALKAAVDNEPERDPPERTNWGEGVALGHNEAFARLRAIKART